IGVNSRLDTIQAAILRVKLRHLDSFNEARARAAAFYDSQLSGLPGITVPERSSFSSHIFHQYTLKIAGGERNALRECLENEGIPAMIYYPVPAHMQKAYLHLGYRPDDFPVSAKLSGEVLSLPMHTELDDEQLAYITNCIRSKFI
ncbi:MAG TPA: DegT/DnrJ/EryC1/StrS family aminotransferase, partial [Bacteroidales bacterium]|nr:DegT/DnrJ/EryC1/StrS family aminotransferase [Bacteroidales bacterium]